MSSLFILLHLLITTSTHSNLPFGGEEEGKGGGENRRDRGEEGEEKRRDEENRRGERKGHIRVGFNENHTVAGAV